MGLAADRNTPRRDGRDFSYPVGANKKLYAGGIVVLNAGNAEPASAALNLIAVGIARAQVDNTGGLAGDKKVPVVTGIYRMNNSANADAIAASDIGNVAFLVDDQTVAKTDNGGTRSPAGKIVDVDSLGVWVDFDPKGAGIGFNS